MKMILRNSLILLLISSCACFKVKDDVRRYWSIRFNECRCQNYSFKEISGLDKFIPCEDFFAKYDPKKPILPNHMYCEDLVGFSNKSWTSNITPNAKRTKACVEDRGGCK